MSTWLWPAEQIGLDPEGYVLAVHQADRLGYLAPCDEWTDLGEPLPEGMQHVADGLAEQGRIADLRGPHVGGNAGG